MNQPNSNQNQTGHSAFPSQQSAQTNPFTQDLKSEFSSNFGTNTNAVSQIFKEGGFVGENRTKYLIAGGVVVILLAMVFYFTLDQGSEFDEDFTIDENLTEEVPLPANEANELGNLQNEENLALENQAVSETENITEEAPAENIAEEVAPVQEEYVASGAGPALEMPADGQSVSYDETAGPAEFRWGGEAGGWLLLSRNPNMAPVERKFRVSGNSYQMHNAYPGTWYWAVENNSGRSEVRSFRVDAPTRRNLLITQPQTGGVLAGTGGVVNWQGDAKVAYYRVELTNSSWAQPYRFATSGNAVQLNAVPAGEYQMRVGAFSEVAGRWEYTDAIAVTVQ